MPNIRIGKPHKKAKQVTGEKTKLKKLGDLKKLNKEIDKVFARDQKRFEKNDKMFAKKQKLQEQLGIE